MKLPRPTTRSGSVGGAALALALMAAAPSLWHVQGATTPQPSKLTVPSIKTIPVRNLNGEAVMDNALGSYPCPLVVQRTVTCEAASTGKTCMESFEFSGEAQCVAERRARLTALAIPGLPTEVAVLDANGTPRNAGVRHGNCPLQQQVRTDVVITTIPPTRADGWSYEILTNRTVLRGEYPNRECVMSFAHARQLESLYIPEAVVTACNPPVKVGADGWC
jgi:hypothetical protein